MKKLLYSLLCLVLTTVAMAQIPTSGLLAHYPFNNNLNDVSGNAQNLTNTGSSNALTYVAGYDTVNTAADFYLAGNSCATLAKTNFPGLNDSTITVSFWLYVPTAGVNSNQILFVSRNSNNGIGGFVVEMVTNLGDDVFIRFYSYSTTNYATYSVLNRTIPANTGFINKWQHITFVCNSGLSSGAINMYINGQSVGSTGGNLPKCNTGANKIDISLAPPNCVTTARLDEMLIYNRPLSASEVADIYDAQYTGSCQNTITAAVPSSIKVCPANPVRIPVSITAGLNPNFEWFKDGQPIANSNNDTLNLPASATNNGSYTVRITTSCDTVTLSPTAVVMVDANFVPVLTENAGQLTVSPADGSSYNWYRDGVLFAGNSTLASITQSGLGVYSVEIVYGVGANSCTSEPSAGVLYCPAANEVVANGFLFGAINESFCEDPQGGGLIRSETSGFAQRTYQWYKGGQPIQGATSANYLFTTNLSAAGLYTYRVSSACDTAFSTNFEVIILPKPTVSISASGSTLTASTPGNNNYDWYYNGNAIASGQSISAVGNGIYTVFVTDANGCVSLESAPFSYTASGCNNTISISGGALSGQFCESASLTLNMQPTINAGTSLTYQWYKDNVLIPGATNLRFEFQSLVANNGTYSIVVASNCDTVTYGNLVVDIVARLATPAITANGTTLSATTTANSYQWFLDGVLLTDNTQSITASADGIYRVIAVGFCSSDTSAAYNYEANRVCSFTTTYTVGAGNCTSVTFEVDGATLPVTAFISYTGQPTPNTFVFDSLATILSDFCPSTYLVTLSDANGCTDTLTFTLTEVGIGEVNSNINLSLYPNPASQTIALSTSEILTGVEIYNVMGQRVLSVLGSVTQLDVTTLPAGTYYLNAITNSGSARKPFVKY